MRRRRTAKGHRGLKKTNNADRLFNDPYGVLRTRWYQVTNELKDVEINRFVVFVKITIIGARRLQAGFVSDLDGAMLVMKQVMDVDLGRSYPSRHDHQKRRQQNTYGLFSAHGDTK